MLVHTVGGCIDLLDGVQGVDNLLDRYCLICPDNNGRFGCATFEGFGEFEFHVSGIDGVGANIVLYGVVGDIYGQILLHSRVTAAFGEVEGDGVGTDERRGNHEENEQ